MMSIVEIIAPNDVALAEHAAVIRALGKRVVGDVIEIGRRLADCKERLKEERRWLAWLKDEFGWHRQTAENLINVFECSKVRNFSTLDVPVSALYLLAAPSTPDEAREAVVTAAADGDRLTHAEVKEIVAKAVADARLEQQQTTDDAAQAVAELKAEYERREREVRAEYADKVVIDQTDVPAYIAQQLEPLKLELAAAERKLESTQKKLDKAKQKTPADAPKMPKINANISLRATSIKSDAERFASDLKITAEQMIDVEAKSAVVTGQHVRDRLADTLDHARKISKWLDGFIEQAKEACK
jgi:hypothetical protein